MGRPPSTERNAAIVHRYVVEQATVAECAIGFGISTRRILQVLHAAKVELRAPVLTGARPPKARPPKIDLGERRFYLRCGCGSRLLLGRRDPESGAWLPHDFTEQRVAPWFLEHSRCMDRAAVRQEAAS